MVPAYSLLIQPENFLESLAAGVDPTEVLWIEWDVRSVLAKRRVVCSPRTDDKRVGVVGGALDCLVERDAE